MRFLEDDEMDDPLLSVVNLIDLFLVVIGILLIVIVQNPLNPFNQQDMTIIENPGKDNMKIIIKQGEELTKYETSQQIGEGVGSKVGATYRLDDGRMIYIPE
ncbi:DUF2149 domain-containing protein [Orbus sasakiae]|uniref:DUF2149 domain-containing protein n=1 Tax=Orbus sasakiae TaxID=1078475 RepID=A0ABP9NBX0_9GAMM